MHHRSVVLAVLASNPFSCTQHLWDNESDASSVSFALNTGLEVAFSSSFFVIIIQDLAFCDHYSAAL
jgi:hypothetical protein